MQKRERYNGLDGLRTYAILGIVMMHVLVSGGYRRYGFILQRIVPAFTNFVFLFMMVSAFGMCCGYYEKIRSGSISVDKFYGKRYEKIWPYFSLLCLLDLVISPSKEALYEVFANLTLCFGLLPNADISVIGVGWTLGVIFVFYLLFPFFCYLIGNKKRACFTLVMTLIFNYISASYFDCGRSNIIYSSVYFVTGGMIYLYREPLKKIAIEQKVLVWFIAVAAAVVYFLVGGNTLTMLLISAVLLIYALGINRGGVLLNPFTRFISSISFEIYLCHMVIYRVIEKLHLTHIVDNDVISYVITCMGTILGAVIFSVVVQKCIKVVKNLLNTRKV